MSLPNLTFGSSSPPTPCPHYGSGRHCTGCGASLHPDAKALGPRTCKKQHEVLCQSGFDYCPHCGQDISIHRFFLVA